jgi:hypothetical protein
MYQCGVSDIRIHPLTYEFYALVNRCDDRNFMHLLAALLANASFAVMSLGQNRGFHLFMATAWFITGSALFPPLPRTPLSFWRNLIVCELFKVPPEL